MIGQGHHTGARLAIHFKDVVDRFEFSDGCLIGIMNDNADSNYSMTPELQ